MENISKVLRDHLLGLQHIGHVVADLNAAVAEFLRVYGVDPDTVRWEPPPGVETDSRFAFVSVAGCEFELIEPVSEKMRKTLLAKPSGSAGINHVAWRVQDMDGALEILASQGVYPGHVTPAGPVRFGNKALVYLDPATTGDMLIELVEVFV